MRGGERTPSPHSPPRCLSMLQRPRHRRAWLSGPPAHVPCLSGPSPPSPPPAMGCSHACCTKAAAKEEGVGVQEKGEAAREGAKCRMSRRAGKEDIGAIHFKQSDVDREARARAAMPHRVGHVCIAVGQRRVRAWPGRACRAAAGPRGEGGCNSRRSRARGGGGGAANCAAAGSGDPAKDLDGVRLG